MRLVISFAALFLSTYLVQLGSGSLGPLDALSGALLGWSTAEIGLLGSAHFAGFFLGCWAMPRLIGSVGHSRAFAAAAALGAIGVILHPVVQGPLVWAGLRFLSGISIAGAYTAVESWLQAKIESRTRGRVFGIYRLVDLSGAICAQSLIAVLEPAAYASYNIVAVFCCASLVPLMLSRQVPPVVAHAPRLRPLKAWAVSPLACFAIVTAGSTGSSFRMIGPVFGIEYELSQDQIALFLIASVIGAALAQFPVGWLADTVDRRKVMIGLSICAMAVSLTVVFVLRPGDALGLVLASAAFGATSITVYSVAAAHANDFCPPGFVVELNAALILFYSVGAVAAPLTSAWLIELWGANALFGFIAAAHLVLIAFSLYRMTRRKAGTPTTPYRYLPRTSMVLARLFRRANGAGASAAPAREETGQ
ncbi:MAG TPA: MFS transporter [Paracoccaceae bacterium]|nr:MFS transporter [Paracoccaceae bacterium]